MRIHFFNPGSIHQVSGGYLYNYHLLEQLKLKGFEICIHEVTGKIGDLILPVSFSKKDLFLIDSLLLAENSTFILALQKRVAVIGLIHLPQFFDPKHKDSKLRASIFKKEQVLFSKIPILVISTYIRTQIISIFKIPGDHVFVLEPGVTPSKRKKAYRKQPKRLLTLANFIPGKGHHRIVNALAALKEYEWELDCYGSDKMDPVYFKNFLKLIKGYDLKKRIRYKGIAPYKTVNELMCRSDLLIQHSAFETYGMVIAEAQASRLPLISTSVGAYEQFSKNSGGLFLDDFEESTLIYELEKLFTSTSAYQELAASYLDIPTRNWTKVAEDFIGLLSSGFQNKQPAKC